MCMGAYFRAETANGVQLCYVVGKCRITHETTDDSKTGTASSFICSSTPSAYYAGSRNCKCKYLSLDRHADDFAKDTFCAQNAASFCSKSNRRNPWQLKNCLKADIGTRGQTVSQLILSRVNSQLSRQGIAIQNKSWDEHIKLEESPSWRKPTASIKYSVPLSTGIGLAAIGNWLLSSCIVCDFNWCRRADQRGGIGQKS